ncbi:hypothetical protein HanXRQr2_Chr10g0445651 [Helianthus annuus]|uniref:Uncharacterized protein n=1 Tax=Helianthus annuus TaxID=4232 RepID=A0A9K3N4U1_HELAN|nr:hypothetical protein HanXRQr2_Chr10g0445651 [Helianthus annuus]
MERIFSDPEAHVCTLIGSFVLTLTLLKYQITKTVLKYCLAFSVFRFIVMQESLSSMTLLCVK